MKAKNVKSAKILEAKEAEFEKKHKAGELYFVKTGRLKPQTCHHFDMMDAHGRQEGRVLFGLLLQYEMFSASEVQSMLQVAIGLCDETNVARLQLKFSKGGWYPQVAEN